ncbi:MAG: prepilin-type N-terminal cleavage/methylation domain-containing protein [Candidatus Paceibacterota bacterium]|jgi:prepilin-type N-terminal cleavage/methylation domain-containing protein
MLNLKMIRSFRIYLAGERGYTLIELLVVVVMIGIMTAIVFANPNVWQSSLSLDRSAQAMSQKISESRGLAMKGFNETGSCSGINGYGIYFSQASSSQYIIYRNCNADYSYDPAADQQIGSAVQLENNILIYNLKVNGATTTALSIAFEPPNPEVYMNNSSSATSSVTLSIQGDPGKQKTVEINGRGVINIK